MNFSILQHEAWKHSPTHTRETCTFTTEDSREENETLQDSELYAHMTWQMRLDLLLYLLTVFGKSVMMPDKLND